MSKAQLKKYLQTLPHEQIVQVVLDLYDARKAAKEYLEFYMDPDAAKAVENAKKAVLKVFYTPQGHIRAKVRAKDASDIVADFLKLQTDSEYMSDLYLFHVEVILSWLCNRRIIRETAWNSVVSLFRKAADYLAATDNLVKLQPRIEKIMKFCHVAPEYLRVPQRLRQELEEAKSNN